MTDGKALLSTTSKYLVTFGKSNKAAYDVFVNEAKSQFSDVDCTLNDTTNSGMCRWTADSCDAYTSKLKAFTIKFDDVVYTIPSMILAATTVMDGKKLCYLSVAYDESSSDDTVFIGLPFAQTFVTNFDYAEGKLKFGQNVNAGEGTKIVGPPKPKTMSPGSKFAVVCLVFGITTIIICTLVYIWRCKRQS